MPPFLRRLIRSLRGESLTARAGRSALWAVGGMATSQFLRLGSNLVLTRLLFPEAFGLMALVQIFLTGLQLFSDIGVHTSIIQNDRSREPAFLDTAWSLALLRGVALWLAACALAWPMAALYDEPQLAVLLPVLGLSTVINGFLPMRVFTANRDLVLGLQTRLDIIAQLAGIVAMISLALLLESVWALVFGSLLSTAVGVILKWHRLPGHRERFRIERSAAGELIHFGKWIFLSTICGFLVNHADRAILGKFISLEMLGIYSIGFMFAGLPMMLAGPLVGKIVFPLYKQRPPSESAENRAKIFRMRWLLTAGLLSLSAILAFSGDWLVHLLYDDRYRLAGPILVVIAVAQMPTVILSSYDQLLLAAGDSRRFLTRVATSAVVQVALLIVGVMSFGILGAAVAGGATALIVYPLLVRLIRRYDGWDPRHDATYAALALGIAALALWVNHGAIAILIAETVPQ